MTDQDVSDVRVVERVDQADVLLTGDPEDVLHPLGLKTTHHQVRDVLRRRTFALPVGGVLWGHGENVGRAPIRSQPTTPDRVVATAQGARSAVRVVVDSGACRRRPNRRPASTMDIVPPP